MPNIHNFKNFSHHCAKEKAPVKLKTLKRIAHSATKAEETSVELMHHQNQTKVYTQCQKTPAIYKTLSRLGQEDH